jgi:hypothetical protein
MGAQNGVKVLLCLVAIETSIIMLVNIKCL